MTSWWQDKTAHEQADAFIQHAIDKYMAGGRPTLVTHYFSHKSNGSAALSNWSNEFEAMEDWESDSECEDDEIEEIAHPGSLPVLDIGSRGGLSVEVGLGTDLNLNEYQEESDVRSNILLTSADTSSPVESLDLSTKLLLLAPKACGCSYIFPHQVRSRQRSHLRSLPWSCILLIRPEEGTKTLGLIYS